MSPPIYFGGVMTKEEKAHCNNHDRQTELVEGNAIALASINGGVTILKWVIGLTLPMLVTTSFILLNNISSELKGIGKQVSLLTSGQQVTDAKIDAQEKAISEIKDRIAMLESRKGM